MRICWPLLVDTQSCVCRSVPAAADAAVRATLHKVLRDEVDHARLGWAHLAAVARTGTAGWLSPHIPAMLRAALGGQLAPVDAAAPDPDLSDYGLLPHAEVLNVVRAVAADVLFPGLERFGVDTAEARASLPS